MFGKNHIWQKSYLAKTIFGKNYIWQETRRNIAKGKTSQAITSYHFLNYCNAKSTNANIIIHKYKHNYTQIQT